MVEIFLHFAIKIVLLLIEKAARDVLMNKINQFLLSMYIYVRGICTDTRVCKLCYVVM